MSKNKEALGKGIRALLNSMDEAPVKKEKEELIVPNSGIRFVKLSQIEVNPFQPRVNFEEESLNELAESIKIHGVIQPVTLRSLGDGKYQLIAGERRLRASKLAGKDDIPAFVRAANDQESLEIALIENIQREDLNAIEIGLNYKRLIDECSLSQEELADRLGKKRSTVANYLRLLKLPPDVQAGLKGNMVSMGHAKAIASLQKVDEQLFVFKEIKTKDLTVRQTEKLVSDMQETKAAKTGKSQKALPYSLQKVQDHLESMLSTKVQLKHGKNGKGQIVVSYYSDSDLERIIESLGGDH